MIPKFCKDTLDITLVLSEEEAAELKRSKVHTPVVEGEDKGLEFHLINSDFSDYIKVIEPREESSNPNYWIKINDAAYAELIRDGKCGTRYGSSSKISIIIGNDF